MESLKISNLSFQFLERELLQDLTFTLQPGQISVLVGSSGAGKSTLLKLLAGLLKPTNGTIFLGDERVPFPEEKLIPGHQQIKHIAQDFELMPFISARENIYQDALHLLDHEKAAIADELLETFKLQNVAHHKLKTLSGGEKQRIALAKAIASKPKVLLFDEVFSQLDLATKTEILVNLKAYLKKEKSTALFVLHDAHDAFYLADNVLVLQNGRLVQNDTVEQIFKNSVNSEVAELFGHVNVLPEKMAQQIFPSIFQDFKQQGLDVWFRPINKTHLLGEYEIVEAFFNGHKQIQIVKIGNHKIWLEL